MAKSEKELLSFIKQYLNNRGLDSEVRREYAVSECGELDGMASIRLLGMIKNRI